MRLSGLQKEVLKLYRQCFREARKKPEVRFNYPSPVATNIMKGFTWQFPGSNSVLTQVVP
jgi:hypothetical protein